MSDPTGCLVLVPVSLGETSWQRFLPAEAHAEVVSIRHFVVENAKAARAQLKRLAHPLPIAELDIAPLPPSGPSDELDRLLAPTAQGLDVGLMSDAGCPGVADPGSRLVARAHALGIRVRPLVGPSSILLALMASGLNGQSFAFDGYLPVAEAARDARIRALEDESRKLSRT
ncbi:MAG: SAM-dependent methyltransferase, partial [Zoogloeaceae bacterium]|nr:SAM-dependent methyltransferase [Zoogloeaceae bacterium]